MTSIFSRLPEVIKVHVRAKFYQSLAVHELSCWQRKTQLKNNTAVATAGSNNEGFRYETKAKNVQGKRCVYFCYVTWTAASWLTSAMTVTSRPSRTTLTYPNIVPTRITMLMFGLVIFTSLQPTKDNITIINYLLSTNIVCCISIHKSAVKFKQTWARTRPKRLSQHRKKGTDKKFGKWDAKCRLSSHLSLR